MTQNLCHNKQLFLVLPVSYQNTAEHVLSPMQLHGLEYLVLTSLALYKSALGKALPSMLCSLGLYHLPLTLPSFPGTGDLHFFWQLLSALSALTFDSGLVTSLFHHDCSSFCSYSRMSRWPAWLLLVRTGQSPQLLCTCTSHPCSTVSQLCCNHALESLVCLHICPCQGGHFSSCLI